MTDREEFEAWLNSDEVQSALDHCGELRRADFWFAWQAARTSRENTPHPGDNPRGGKKGA